MISQKEHRKNESQDHTNNVRWPRPSQVANGERRKHDQGAQNVCRERQLAFGYHSARQSRIVFGANYIHRVGARMTSRAFRKLLPRLILREF
jgi:hypothetical protein